MADGPSGLAWSEDQACAEGFLTGAGRRWNQGKHLRILNY
jgi:hypothetical protein